MRISSLILVLFCFTGCFQDAAKDFSTKPGKIPIDPQRWYQLNNSTTGLGALFNGKEEDKLRTTDGALLANYDSYYPLLDGEQMTIDSIKLFDWEGTNEDHPMTIYAILNDWRKVPVAIFTGSRYNEWVGPNPSYPHKYALDKPVSGIKCLVINSWGDFPGEIEFYGPYVAPHKIQAIQVSNAPLSNFFGVNAYEWDFETPDDPMKLDARRLEAFKSFTAVRHYLDWEKLEGQEGIYAFAPTYNGSWNYDAIYEWCKAHNVEALACLKTVPAWMQASYPEQERDNELIPMRYGKDPADPKSYVEQAKAAFQFAARYGSNKNVDGKLLTMKPDNRVRVGLNLVRYIECDNERDKWWKGRKAYQTGREYAANLSAFYDGDKNTMGQGVGVKNADPAMKVVMAGLALPSTDYLRGMIDWSKEHRGYRKDGSVDCPWDVINYHFYANDASAGDGRTQTTGVAPEAAKADSFARTFIQAAHVYANDMPVWVTETGYDINPGSPQRAPALHGISAEQKQADWILRTSLLYARTGVQKVFFYQMHDDKTGSSERYATSGLVNKDGSNRPAADFLFQTNKLFGEYLYKRTISVRPQVDEYSLGSKQMYVLVQQEGENNEAVYTLNVGAAGEAYLYRPQTGSREMNVTTQKVINGKVVVPLSATPVFVTTYKSDEIIK